MGWYTCSVLSACEALICVAYVLCNTHRSDFKCHIYHILSQVTFLAHHVMWNLNYLGQSMASPLRASASLRLALFCAALCRVRLQLDWPSLPPLQLHNIVLSQPAAASTHTYPVCVSVCLSEDLSVCLFQRRWPTESAVHMEFIIPPYPSNRPPNVDLRLKFN